MADQRTLRVVVVGNSSGAQSAISDLADTSENAGQQFEGMGGKMGGLKEGLAGLGAAAAGALSIGALVEGFNAGLDRIGQKAKLAAQLGVSGPEAAKAGKIAGDLYVNGFGGSFEEAAAVTKTVAQDMNVNLNSPDFKPLAGKVSTLATTFDQDLGGVTRAVSQMMRTGLAKNSSEALDIITAGMTHGVDKSQDFLDTLNEYGTQFRKLGLDGATATGLLSQGLKGGARDADLVADALKEFSIRAVDGSKTTAAGYQALGLDAKKLTEQMAKGGPEASKGLGTVLTKLKAIKDPAKQSQAAVALFGTQAEDLGKALYSLDPSTAVKGLGDVAGAAQKMTDTMGDNPAAKVETFKRRVTNGLTEGFASVITAADGLSQKLGPVFSKIGQAVGPFMKTLGDLGGKIKTSFETGAARAALDQLGAKLQGIWTVVGPALTQFVTFFKTNLVPLFMELWQKAAPVLQQLWQTFMTYLDAIKVEVQVFVAVVKWLWATFGETIISYVKTAWNAIWQVISGVLSVIQGIYNVFIGIFTGNWSKAWTGIKQIFSGVWNIIAGIFHAVMGTIKTILKLALDAIKGLWHLAWSGIKAFFSSIWNGIAGFFSGAMSRLRGYASSGVNAVKSFFINGFHSLYTGVVSKVGSVVSTVKSIPGKITGALKGLGGTLMGIGKNIIQGLVNGIRNSLGAVMSAARAIVDHIPGPIRKALGIHSPSRVMAEIGKWVTKGLVKGMLSGAKGVQATAKKLHELITKAYHGKAISKKKADQLHKYLHKQDTKLYKLAKRREAIAKKLTAANAKLTDMKKARADMAGSIAGKARDYGSFMGAYDSSEYGDNSASAILSRLKAKLKGIMDFRKNLGTLAKRGLGKGIINEIAQAGPDAGGQMAQALLNAGGGQIKELNSTYSAISGQSKALGDQVAGQYYDAGIHATQGLIKGLSSQEKALTKQIENMSKAMVKALKKALGIKSPSRVFKGLGVWTGKGFAHGIHATHGDVQEAVNGLAAVRPTGRLANSSITRERSWAAQAAANAAPTVYVTVQGNVTSEKALARSVATVVRDEIVRNGKRNGGRTGL
jgi:TP901 family phage tail tape measure protein